jgi:hypothetical protein
LTAAAWIALAGVGLAVLAHFGAFVYAFATLAERNRQQARKIEAIENAPKDDCAVQLAAMTAILSEMGKRLDRMDAGMDSRLSNLETRIDAAIKHNGAPARRRAA